jgi:hypothetical protein
VALDLIFCVFHGLAEFCDCRRRQKKSVFFVGLSGVLGYQSLTSFEERF